MSDVNQVGQSALSKAPGPMRRLLSGINPQFSLFSGQTQAIGPQPSQDGPIAGVEAGSPNRILVTDPARFAQSPRQTAVHEASHVIGNNLSPEQRRQIPADTGNPLIALDPKYLSQQRASGKSILQLPEEQRSYLSQYYAAQQEAYEKGAISPQQMQHVEQTYGPWIQDWNKAQLSNIQPTDPSSNTLNTTPRAPMPPVNLQQDSVQFDPSQQGPVTQSVLAGMNQPAQPAPQYVPPVVANTHKWQTYVQGALAGLGGGLKAGLQNIQDAGTARGPHANGYAEGEAASQQLQNQQAQQQQQATQQAQQDYQDKLKSAQFTQEQQLNRARTMEANLHLLKMGQDIDNAPEEAKAEYYKGQDSHESELRKEGMSSLGEVGDLNSAMQWMQQNKKNTADVVFTHHKGEDGKDRIAIWENPSHSVDAGSINARLHNKNDHVSPGVAMNAGDAYSYVNGRNSKYSDQQAAQALQTQKDAASMQRTQATQAGENARQQKTMSAKSLSGSPGGDALADEIGQGKMAPERISYLLTRNPDLMKAVAEKYPDFDSSKVASYAKTYQDFTNGKSAQALNSGSTALGHLKELRDLNTVQSHIPGTPDYVAYQNKATTLATELAAFYGKSTVSEIDKIEKTLKSTLPGTRDAAIRTQAQSMGDKFDAYETQWKNAAPSASYQAPMPGISDKARENRAALDPNYGKTALPTGHKAGDVVTVKGGKKVKITQVHPDGSFDAE